jgi:hypothetical protein
MAASKRIFFKNISYLAQREIKTIKDIENVLNLDEAHWSATGASIESINCDPVFLELIDFDNNMRIMCFEVKEAIRWLFRNLNDKKGILEESTTLNLDAINTTHKEGKDLYVSATQIMARLGRENEKQISLSEIRKIKKKVKETPISEAGVVLPEATENPHIRLMIHDIIKTVGGIPHPGGKTGVTLEKLEEFLENSDNYLRWYNKGETTGGKDTSPIMVLGKATEKAFFAYISIRDKINHYFTLCKMLALSQGIGVTESTYEPQTHEEYDKKALPDYTDVCSIEAYLIKAPLAVPQKNRILRLDQIINTYFEDQVLEFRQDVVAPVFGEKVNSLTEKQWKQITSMFVEYEKWQGEKKGEIVASIQAETLKGYLNNELISKIKALIAESNETALVLDEIRLIEKLVLFQALMRRFLNNFVSFPYLYDPEKRAMFEMGTLIMDGRRFNLSVRVDIHEKHVQVARNSNMFILYVNVLSATDKKYEVAVPVTSGGIGNLYIGKHGIFHDTTNTDWDAEIIDIIENPISLGEALSRPFKNLFRLINTKIEELKSVAESKIGTVLKPEELATQQQQTGQTPATTATAGKTQGLGNLFMGGSIAVAALGSAIAFITKTLSEVKWTTLVFTILGAFCAVLFPTFISAFLKLKKRDMTTILEASGWAINIRMKCSFKLGRFFTLRPKPPFRFISFRWLAWVLVILLTGVLIGLFIYFEPSVTVSVQKKVTFTLFLHDTGSTCYSKQIFSDIRDSSSPGAKHCATASGYIEKVPLKNNVYKADMISSGLLATNKRYVLRFFIDMDGNKEPSPGDLGGMQQFDVLSDAAQAEATVFLEDLAITE